MPKTEGCWANVLDDCAGALTGEHLMSVSVFAPATGRPNNRRGRLARGVRVEGGHHIPDGHRTVKSLTAGILCVHHNNSTNNLDSEGGRFAQALSDWDETEAHRSRMPPMRWKEVAFEVNGPLLERFFLKLAINNCFLDGGPPIGGPDALPGWPTRELVEMVYGHRPVTRPAGLFNLSKVGTRHQFGRETFTPIYFDNGRYREGCVWMFRTLALGVQFTTENLPERIFDGVSELRGRARFQPFAEMDSPNKVVLRLRW